MTRRITHPQLLETKGALGPAALLALCATWFVPAAHAQFPAAGDDSFNSRGVFKMSFSPALGGGTMVIWVDGPTCVARSGPHGQGVDPSGGLGDGTLCGPNSPTAATSDAQIGFFPPGFNAGGGVDEVHTEIVDMNLTALFGPAFTFLAGASATGPLPRSLGEVEARGGSGFPADSFFNLFVEVNVPGTFPGGPDTLYNATPLTVMARRIRAFPPARSSYLHSFDIIGRVKLYKRSDGCFAGYLEQGTHSVRPVGPPPVQPPVLRNLKIEFPTVFSIGTNGEGLLVPDPCVPPGHPEPNDVYALGFAGLTNVPPSHGYMTEGELFQSSGASLGAALDLTNVDRMSAALGIGPTPGPLPYVGPFDPNTGAPIPAPIPPGGLMGTLGLVPGDNITSLSFGMDGGNTLLFSVDPTAVGAGGSAVQFDSTLSPTAPPLISGVQTPSNGGGDPGDEAAGDVYISARFGLFGRGARLVGLVPAPAGTNILGADEAFLGLQAPAVRHSSLGREEDDLDALEVDDAAVVDANTDGVIDAGNFVFFTLDSASLSLPGVATPADILVSTSPTPGPIFGFTIYAAGAAQLGLLAGDEIDALAVSDNGPLGAGPPDGIWNFGDDVLFSLKAGSPSLTAGANVNMPAPPPGGFSPGDVYRVLFAAPPPVPLIMLYAPAAGLGLLVDDELNALDIGYAFPCDGIENGDGEDEDQDGVPDICDNCPDTFNPQDSQFGEQLDSDGDGVGDLCDNCPYDYNPLQAIVCALGACCLQNGGCTEAMDEIFCQVALGGQWDGADTNCGDIEPFVNCISGPEGGLVLSACVVWDFDGDDDVDLADYGEVQRQGFVSPCNPATPGQILINEIWANDFGVDDAEFIELYGAPSTDLSPYSLIVVDGDTLNDSGSSNFRKINLWLDLAGRSLDGDGFFVTGTGSLTVDAALEDLAVMGFSPTNTNGLADDIQNGSQTYALVWTEDISYFEDTGQLSDEAVEIINTNAIDTVATRDSALDHVYFFAPETLTSMGMVFGYAQRIPNGTDGNSPGDWEALSPTAVGEIGGPADPSTPGAENQSQGDIPGACCNGEVCTVVTQDVCAAGGGTFIGPGTSCFPVDPCQCISIAEARLLPSGELVTLCDAAISSTADLIGSTMSRNFHMQDGTGGITVFGSNSDIDAILTAADEGHQIDLSGETSSFNGLLELVAPFGQVHVDGFVGIPDPAPTTTNDYQDGSATAEFLESQLVVLECVEFEDAGGTFAGASNYNVTPMGGGPAAVVRVSTNQLDLVGMTIPSGPVTLTGIFSQFDTTDPRDGDYQLLLRSADDITACP